MTVPHSCYTKTITTSAHDISKLNFGESLEALLTKLIGCPVLSCGAVPECAILSTETVIVPPSDACCPTTPTSVVDAPCPTCPTGCAIVVSTEYITTASAKKRGEPLTVVSTLAPTSTSTPCTTTMLVAGALTFGPVKTVHATTIVKTVYEDCGGCETLITRGIEGIGPVVIFTTTVTDPAPATVTEYACSKPVW